MMDMMGFGYRLYPSYNEYNGVGGKGIDKMIGQAQGLAQAVLICMQRRLCALSVRVFKCSPSQRRLR